MTSLVLTITETLRYRGAIGQWSWVLHRISGLGIVLFLTLHVIDTSWALFYPDLYVKAIATYQTPLFTIGEFALVACVVYHAFNGIRITLFDFNPRWWQHQEKAAVYVLLLTVLVLIPVFGLMFGHVLEFYNNEPQVLPLSEVIEGQLPFVVGMVVALVAAVLYAGLRGLITGNGRAGAAPRRSDSERFWWSYMRVSGLLILPLVFGHLALMHVIQGVFDITAANYTVVGTGVMNTSGTAVEFVAERWNLLLGGVAIWRLYDFGLLALTVIHGFNGLRYVLTDYTMSSVLMRRAMVYLCVIGAVVLLVLGVGALLGTIDSAAVEMAQEAMAKLH